MPLLTGRLLNKLPPTPLFSMGGVAFYSPSLYNPSLYPTHAIDSVSSAINSSWVGIPSSIIAVSTARIDACSTALDCASDNRIYPDSSFPYVQHSCTQDGYRSKHVQKVCFHVPYKYNARSAPHTRTHTIEQSFFNHNSNISRKPARLARFRPCLMKPTKRFCVRVWINP